jgi:hypothetical protein
MSCPTKENLSLAWQVIKYIIGSLDLKITYRPDDPNDPPSEINNELMMFTDSDWATSVDTRCSHGCCVIIFAGVAIAHRSKSHKSVMLSSAAVEYYEASEGCRELAYIPGILPGTFMAPSAHPPRHTSTIRPALQWPKCLCFPRSRSIFQFEYVICASVAQTRWVSCVPLAQDLKSQTSEARPFQSPPL